MCPAGYTLSMSSPPSLDGSNSVDLRFFDGFAWAVPTAFAGALAAFRFEQGDVIHSSRAQYGPDAKPIEGDSTALALQVLAPPRSARSVSSEADGDRRRVSFESEVVLAVVDLPTGQRREIKTTQGRLLMTLWRGEMTWIEGEGVAPALPLGARDLAGRLDDLATRFKALSADRPGFRCESDTPVFLFVVDLASDASRVKAEAIREALAFVEGGTTLDLTPVRLDLEDANAFHPALVVRGLALPGVSAENVTEALRGALYGGGRAGSSSGGEDSSGTQDGGGTERFSLARHGLLAAFSA
jgi:hypothetical protein